MYRFKNRLLLVLNYFFTEVSEAHLIIILFLYSILYYFSIITQVIIEILALSLAENGVIFRFIK